MNDDKRDADRWRLIEESNKGYTREPLVNPRTGEVLPGVKRWTIWIDLPDAALLHDAIDAALKAP